MNYDEVISLGWKDRNPKSKGGNKSFVFEAPGFDYHIMTVFFGIPEEDGFFDQIMINCVPQNTTVNEWENSETHFYGQVKTRSELEMIMMFLGIIEYSLPPAEGAEEILDKYWDNFHDSVWDASLKAMHEFATIHAQRLADKMVEKTAIDFANWLDKLQPSQRTSVWSKNGEYKGLFTMDNEQLYENYLKSRER